MRATSVGAERYLYRCIVEFRRGFACLPALTKEIQDSTAPATKMQLSTLLISLLATTAAAGRRPCGFKIAPCQSGWTCQKVDPACNRGENCEGYCIPTKTTLTTVTATPTKAPRPTYQACGGFRVERLDCAKGYHCVDDPYVKGCGMACDRPGICVPETAAFCG